MEEANGEELRRQRDMLAEAHERSAAEARERMLVERERVSRTSNVLHELWPMRMDTSSDLL
jgi:hypothetical protein